MKNFLKLSLIAAVLITSMQCKTPETKTDCGSVMCTMEFRMLNISIKDKAGNIYIADKVETYTKTGKLIFSQTASSAPDSSYTVIDDSNLKDLPKNVNTDLDFKIYKNGAVVKTIKYVVTADCCHINKVSGDAVVVIE